MKIKGMKVKVLVLVVVMMMAMGLMACQNKNAGQANDVDNEFVQKEYEDVIATGQIEGCELEWTVTADKTLYIHGQGYMPAFAYESTKGGMGINHAPWSLQHDLGNITRIVVEEGVTHIGRAAFCGMDRVTSVQLADSIVRIAEYAFFTCTEMKEVNIPKSLEFIGEAAFRDCFEITSVTIPGTVETIPEKCFFACHSLVEIILEEGVKNIEEDAFWSQGTSNIYLPNSIEYIHENPGCSYFICEEGSYAETFCLENGFQCGTDGGAR